MCLQYLQYFLFCAASLPSSVEAVYLCGNKTCFSLCGGQYCLPGHSCNQHFYERNNSSGVLLFQGKGETAAGSRWGWLFCLGFFLFLQCVLQGGAGGRMPRRAQSRAAGSRSQTSLGVWAGVCQNMGEERKRIWVGFCWSFGFGGFLIKVEERFKGGEWMQKIQPGQERVYRRQKL